MATPDARNFGGKDASNHTRRLAYRRRRTLVASSLTPAEAAGQTLSLSSYIQTATTSTGKTLEFA